MNEKKIKYGAVRLQEEKRHAISKITIAVNMKVAIEDGKKNATL